MGLGFSHGGAHWSYSGFNSFRQRIAEAIGIDLYEMEGFYTEEEKNVGLANLREWGSHDWPKKTPWSEIDDPIVPLLCHSDCEGHMTPEECAEVAPRLRQLIADWPDTVIARASDPEKAKAMGYRVEHELDNYDKTNAKKLADGLEECARTGQNLQFC